MANLQRVWAGKAIRIGDVGRVRVPEAPADNCSGAERGRMLEMVRLAQEGAASREEAAEHQAARAMGKQATPAAQGRLFAEEG